MPFQNPYWNWQLWRILLNRLSNRAIISKKLLFFSFKNFPFPFHSQSLLGIKLYTLLALGDPVAVLNSYTILRICLKLSFKIKLLCIKICEGQLKKYSHFPWNWNPSCLIYILLARTRCFVASSGYIILESLIMNSATPEPSFSWRKSTRLIWGG